MTDRRVSTDKRAQAEIVLRDMLAVSRACKGGWVHRQSVPGVGRKAIMGLVGGGLLERDGGWVRPRRNNGFPAST